MNKHSLLLLSFIFLFISKCSFAQTWSEQINPIEGKDVNSAWAVDTNVCWMCGANSTGTSGYVILTTNGGVNWEEVTGNLPVSANGLYTICGISSNEAWVSSINGTVYHTINAGTNWNSITLPAPVTQFVDVIHFFNQNTGFILGDPLNNQWCYYRTTNAGANWTFGPAPSATGTEASWSNDYCALDTGHIWFGTNASLIYKGGFRSGFTPISISSPNCVGVSFVNQNTGVSIFQTTAYFNNTTNGGMNWSTGYPYYYPQYAIKAVPGSPYIWTCGKGPTDGTGVIGGGEILFSSNSGVNWSVQTNLGNIGYCITFANSGCGWVGCKGGLIYKMSGSPIGIHNINTSLPANYSLEQNYPNPFNAMTNIRFILPEAARVTLKVYDILGNEVATILNNEFQKSGINSYLFDATNLSSGVYYYKIITNKFVNMKKMILLK